MGTVAKPLAVVFLSVLVTGCVGTMDALHAVEGETVANDLCEVKVTEASSGRLVENVQVRGKFSVTYVASGPFPPTVDVAAFCGGNKVREVKGVGPRDGTVNLGKIAP